MGKIDWSFWSLQAYFSFSRIEILLESISFHLSELASSTCSSGKYYYDFSEQKLEIIVDSFLQFSELASFTLNSVIKNHSLKIFCKLVEFSNSQFLSEKRFFFRSILSVYDTFVYSLYLQIFVMLKSWKKVPHINREKKLWK